MARTPRSVASVQFPGTHVVMDPTPEQFRQDIMLLERKMGDYRLPLQASKTIIVSDISEAFLKEKDPRGARWVPLSKTAERVPRLGKLRRKKTNARMWRQMSNRRNYGITREGVFLNQSRIEPYMPYHQQDDSATAGQDILVLSKVQRAEKAARTKARLVQKYHTRAYEHYPKAERIQKLREEAEDEVLGEMRQEAGLGRQFIGDVGGFGMIPRRAFIGPSRSAEMKIVKVMDAWAKDVIIIRKRGLKSNPAFTAAHKPGYSGLL